MDIQRLKELRSSARGTEGRLSKAQMVAVKPPEVTLRQGQLVMKASAAPANTGEAAKIANLARRIW